MPSPRGIGTHKHELFVDDDTGKIFAMDSQGNVKVLSFGTGNIYREIRTTTAGQTYVVFDEIPSNLQVLELAWSSYIADGGGDQAILRIRVNDEVEDFGAENFWLITKIDDSGTITRYHDDQSPWNSDDGMGIGILNRYGLTNGMSSGRIQFPSYAQTDDGDNYGRIVAHGNGTVIETGYTPSVYVQGGWLQGGPGPIERIVIRAFDLDVSPWSNGSDWLPGEPAGAIEFHETSRFILTGST